MAKVLFKRGNKAYIDALPIVDGQLIYNTETGETYEDVGDRRIPTGGGITPEELNRPVHTTMYIDIVDDGFGTNYAYYGGDKVSANSILNHANADGLVIARYDVPGTSETRCYYYSQKDSTRQPVFLRSYIENGVSKQAVITVDNNSKVTVTYKTAEKGGAGFVAQPEPPTDTSLLWIDTDDDSEGDNGGWKLIEEVTLSADGAIKFEKEPGGTPYSFRAIDVSFEYTGSAQWGDFAVPVSAGQDADNKDRVAQPYITPCRSAGNAYSGFRVVPYNGFWYSETFNTVPNDSEGRGVVASAPMFYNKFPVVGTKIVSFKTYASLPSGTKITIKAVR